MRPLSYMRKSTMHPCEKRDIYIRCMVIPTHNTQQSESETLCENFRGYVYQQNERNLWAVEGKPPKGWTTKIAGQNNLQTKISMIDKWC